MNRRILYNRASADPDGKPWSERKKYVWWDAERGQWTGFDVPDFKVDMPPDYVPPDGAEAEDALRGDEPFIMQADGRGWLFVAERPDGRADADPLRAARVAVRQPALRPAGEPHARSSTSAPRTRTTPPTGSRARRSSPYVMTTYRLTEHHTAGGDVAHAPLPLRAPARDVLRGEPRARARARPRARRLGDDRERAHRDRGARDGHRADAAPAGPGRASSTRSGCPITGAGAASAPATRRTTCSRSRSTRTSTSRR